VASAWSGWWRCWPMCWSAPGQRDADAGPGDDPSDGLPAAGADLGGGDHAAVGPRPAGRGGALQATVEAMRPSYVQTQPGAGKSGKPSVEKRSSTRSRPRPGRPKPCWPPSPRAAMPPDGALGRPQGRAGATQGRPEAEQPGLALGTPAEDAPAAVGGRFHPRAAVPRNARRQGGLSRPAAGAGGPHGVQADPRRAGRADAAQPGRHLHG
jgi:hypothetical protein